MHTIFIDEIPVQIDLRESRLSFGNAETLAIKHFDIVSNQDWYPLGYSTPQIMTNSEFKDLRSCISEIMQRLLSKFGISIPENFDPEKYHEYIDNSDELHQKFIKFTRELRFEDFNFDLDTLVDNISISTRLSLTKINPILKDSFVILRINRPLTDDFNPPHRDGYLELWEKSLNAWIPIFGVGKGSSLPIVPGSHLIPENLIERTVGDNIMNGLKYRVPAITSWDGSNKMIRPNIQYGEALIFSPYLIHGCAKNLQPRITRIALELRLSQELNRDHE